MVRKWGTCKPKWVNWMQNYCSESHFKIMVFWKLSNTMLMINLSYLNNRMLSHSKARTQNKNMTNNRMHSHIKIITQNKHLTWGHNNNKKNQGRNNQRKNKIINKIEDPNILIHNTINDSLFYTNNHRIHEISLSNWQFI